GALAFCGTGNISAVAYGAGRPIDNRASGGHTHRPASAAPPARECYQLVSRNGIVGHTMRGTQEFELTWSENALLVLHSDGIGTRWDLAAWPGLANQPAAVIAAVLYRDFARRRDDATVVVVRARPGVQLNHE
ncbi:MAG TPA: anti-sigma regulatory factor, partial [Paraburkholderia sp.]|nr:anti-sigma regulatory factor [Paraburkholderia sp.]